MFINKSRYYNLQTIEAVDAEGRSVKAVKLRRLPYTQGEQFTVKSGNQLDVMAKQYYQDGARFWHVADANSELEANDLISEAGRVIGLPKN